MRARSILLATSVLAALLATSGRAAAQTPYGTLRGTVIPASVRPADFRGVTEWGPAAARLPDTVVVARVTLTPLHTYGCRAGRSGACASVALSARGPVGRYGAERLYMGRYRMRVDAPGCASTERDILVRQHTEAVVDVPLDCATAGERL